MDIILYSTDFCQLCEEALVLIEQSLEGRAYHLDIVDISESDDLLASYANNIPLLKRADRYSVELRWPFSADDLLKFIDG